MEESKHILLTWIRSGHIKGILLRLLLAAVAIVLPQWALAHEAWVLTSAQIADWNSRPSPELFQQLNSTNIALTSVAAVFLFGWIMLGRTGAREMFSNLQIRLGSNGGAAALIVRVGVAIMIGMAALGLSPRHGTELFEAPVLVAPDLELRLLSGNWGWLAHVQLAVATFLLLGIYVRFVSAVMLGVAVLGIYLFGYEMWAYAGIAAGACIFLLLQGGGWYCLPLRAPAFIVPLRNWLESQPKERAQFLLRMLVGGNLLYLGIEYKFLQVNLSMALLVLNDVPTFGMEPATFAFIMAMVETLAGALIMAGVLMRAMSVFLFFCFLFLSATLGESIISHAIFYGVLASFFINGGGHWKLPIAADKPGRVVILGGGFAGVYAAMELERLVGKYTNLQIVLVHWESNFLFHPLLPEVVAGTVQPGNVVHPLRRLCPQTHFVQGHVKSVDRERHEVSINLSWDEPVRIKYQQLIIAPDREADVFRVPGSLEHSVPLISVGDGLYLRQRILESVERATTSSSSEVRRRLLTFAVVGGGIKGCAIAAEMRGLLRSAIATCMDIAEDESRVILYEEADRLVPQERASMAVAVAHRLIELGVDIRLGERVSTITASALTLDSGEELATTTVVNTLSITSTWLADMRGVEDRALEMDDFLRLDRNIFVAEDSPQSGAFLAYREIAVGRHAAWNAWAETCGQRIRRWSEPQRVANLLALGGSTSVVRIFGLNFNGAVAGSAFRLSCLLTMPTLERNLRLMLDWIISIAFRRNIAVLVAERSVGLSEVHYEPKADIVRAGEVPRCAYIVRSGKVAVLRSIDGADRKVAELSAGDCFGEQSLFSDEPSGTTMRCLTPVAVEVLPRDKVNRMPDGYQDLTDAIQSRREKRMSEGLRLVESPKPETAGSL